MSSYSTFTHSNGSVEVLNLKLKRHNNSVSWGFNIQGGKEFSSPLLVQKITPNSLADRCSLRPGDYLLRIGSRSVENFTHNDARNAIIEQGNDLELTVQRHAVPRHEDFVAHYNFTNHQLMTPENIETQPKLSPQVGVALKDNKVLLSQSYNSPLGLYSKENIANTLVTTIKNLNLKDDIVDEKNIVDNLKSTAPLSPPSSYKPQSQPTTLPSSTYSNNNTNNFVPNFSPSAPQQQPPPQQQQQIPKTDYYSIQPPYQQQYVPPPQQSQPIPQPQYQPQPKPQPQYQPVKPNFAPSSAGSAPKYDPRPQPPFNPPSGPRSLNRGLSGSAIRKLEHPTVPACSGCNQVIRGPFISAVGKTWCPNHFTCASCGIDLEHIGFIEENGRLYCESDFEKYFAPKCAKCRKAIIGDCCYAIQKAFHPDCFTCTHCNKKIASGGFHVEDGLPYCTQDYNNLFSAKCAGCHYPIDAGDQFVEALNNNWHVECFTCTACHTKLEGIGFVVKSNKPYCKRHAR